MFSLKSDCDIPDDVLKELRNRNHEEFGFNYKKILHLVEHFQYILLKPMNILYSKLILD